MVNAVLPFYFGAPLIRSHAFISGPTKSTYGSMIARECTPNRDIADTYSTHASLGVEQGCGVCLEPFCCLLELHVKDDLLAGGRPAMEISSPPRPLSDNPPTEAFLLTERR